MKFGIKYFVLILCGLLFVTLCTACKPEQDEKKVIINFEGREGTIKINNEGLLIDTEFKFYYVDMYAGTYGTVAIVSEDKQTVFMGLDFERKVFKYLLIGEDEYIGYSFSFEEIYCNVDLNDEAIGTNLINISGYKNTEVLDELSNEELDNLIDYTVWTHLYFKDYEDQRVN